ncbi:MAG: DUF1846 domain-containing protein [Clostridia bacterium]|nr:DUF1846 domain-containing protein [Clostridia bacterium]
MVIGFDNKKYIQLQSEKIRERVKEFGGKLYLEFGGKLFDDYHASRVLPGFAPDSKIRMLKTISSDVEIILAINASDIEKHKMRGDLGITYEDDLIRLAETFRNLGFYVGSVVITQYRGQESVDAYRNRLKANDLDSYLHYPINGYPSDVQFIVSENGFGKNEFVVTKKSLVVVTAPGPGSGKMATCLSQIYHEFQRGIKAGYAKFETFPIWNLPLKHPVNIAYEAATADLNDVNMIDPFHLEAYGVTTVNYNRDVEIFPVLKEMLERIQGKSPYNSPTDMGVNMAGYCIVDDDVCREASKKEILRRYYTAACDSVRKGTGEKTVEKLILLMRQAEVQPSLNPAIQASLDREQQTGGPAAAMVMPDGHIVTGKTSALLGAAASMLLNALKYMAGIDQEEDIISPSAIEPICEMKTQHLHHRNPRLHSDEVLIALTVSASQNKNAALALSMLDSLKNCEAHFSAIPSLVDEKLYKTLGVLLSYEPVLPKKVPRPIVLSED